MQQNVQKLSCHVPITQEQLEDMQTQIWFLTQKVKEVGYSFHWITQLEVIRIKNTFMEVNFFIYQQKVKKTQVEQWEFYKTQIIKILNDAFVSYRKDKIVMTFVTILALGQGPNQRLAKFQAENEAQESHFMFTRMQESVKE